MQLCLLSQLFQVFQPCLASHIIQLASPFCFLAKERKTCRYKTVSKRDKHLKYVTQGKIYGSNTVCVEIEIAGRLFPDSPAPRWFGWLSTQGLHPPLFWPETTQKIWNDIISFWVKLLIIWTELDTRVWRIYSNIQIFLIQIFIRVFVRIIFRIRIYSDIRSYQFSGHKQILTMFLLYFSG